MSSICCCRAEPCGAAMRPWLLRVLGPPLAAGGSRPEALPVGGLARAACWSVVTEWRRPRAEAVVGRACCEEGRRATACNHAKGKVNNDLDECPIPPFSPICKAKCCCKQYPKPSPAGWCPQVAD